jgi:uncharacterized protein YqcC (DUF446 family)
MSQTGLSLKTSLLLIDIEAQLRQLNLWRADLPSAQALASVEPFCIDTLDFPQWLQFVFLPRMHQLLGQNQPLPANCAIAPMAQTYFSVLNFASGELIALIDRLDQLLTR